MTEESNVMAVKSVVICGDQRLRERCEEVTEFGLEALSSIQQDLEDSQQHYDGAGIAAPQIGIQKRIVLFGFQHCERYPERKPIEKTFLINPTYEPLTDELEYAWEGCLSVPGMRGVVARYKTIRYQGFDIQGNIIEREAEGFHARLIQHETDHLDGVLYIDRLVDSHLFGFIDVLDYSLLEKYLAERGLK